MSAEPQQPVKRGRGRPVSFLFYFEVVVAMDNRLILLLNVNRRQWLCGYRS